MARLAWAMTGAGHLLVDCAEVLAGLPAVDLYLSRAAEDVVRMYGLEERLVQAARDELPISIFRPGMIVGDSRTGAIQTFNTVYGPLRLYLTGKLSVLPASPKLRVNLVPVDYVAQAVASLTMDPRAAGLTFHLTVSPENLPTARERLDGDVHREPLVREDGVAERKGHGPGLRGLRNRGMAADDQAIGDLKHGGFSHRIGGAQIIEAGKRLHELQDLGFHQARSTVRLANIAPPSTKLSRASSRHA